MLDFEHTRSEVELFVGSPMHKHVLFQLICNLFLHNIVRSMPILGHSVKHMVIYRLVK